MAMAQICVAVRKAVRKLETVTCKTCRMVLIEFQTVHMIIITGYSTMKFPDMTPKKFVYEVNQVCMQSKYVLQKQGKQLSGNRNRSQ